MFHRQSRKNIRLSYQKEWDMWGGIVWLRYHLEGPEGRVPSEVIALDIEVRVRDHWRLVLNVKTQHSKSIFKIRGNIHGDCFVSCTRNLDRMVDHKIRQDNSPLVPIRRGSDCA